jgi:hypothetical protein
METTNLDANEYIKQWKLKNKNKVKEYNKKFYKKHKENIIASNKIKRHSTAGKEEKKKTNKKYYENNREKILNQQKQYMIMKNV